MNDTIVAECKSAIQELCEVAKLKCGDIVVVGCSTSEVLGSKVGTNSDPDTAKVIFQSIHDFLSSKGIYLAAQCCEHLNRAIVVEAEAVKGAEIVNVIPQPKAGVLSPPQRTTVSGSRLWWRRSKQTLDWISAQR